MMPASERPQTAGQKFIEDMVRMRGMDWVRLGMQVEVDGKPGTIRGTHGANLAVVFKGQHYRSNCHPTWETRYFNTRGEVIANYRADAKPGERGYADGKI